MSLGIAAYSEAPFSSLAETTASVSGIQTTSSLGSITITGELGANAFPTGQALSVTNVTSNADTLTAFAEAPFASESPSTFTPINISVTGTANIFPTQVSLTIAQGDESPAGNANVNITGSTMTSNTGQAFAGAVVDVDITGNNLTSNLGTAILNANSLIDVTGNSLDSEIGQVDPSPDAVATGIGMTATIGVGSVVVATADIDVTGISLTAGIGSLTVTADANIPVTENTLSTFVGNEDTGADANASVTGIELTSIVADVSLTGTGNISVTGNQSTTALGDVDFDSAYTVSGVELTSAIGQVEVDDASAEVTGVSASTSTGTVNITAWSEVNTGVSNAWVEVDIAANKDIIKKMASTYSTDLKLELMATGENAGTWGDKTNSNLDLIEQAIAGYQAVSIAGGAQTTALAMTNATLSNARNAVIQFTGTITGNQIVTIPDGIEKTYTIINATTGAFTVEFKTASGSGFTFSTTDKGTRVCYSDGTNVIDVNALFTTINQFTLPTADGNNGDSLITDGSANLSFTNTFGKALAVQIIFG